MANSSKYLFVAIKILTNRKICLKGPYLLPENIELMKTKTWHESYYKTKN